MSSPERKARRADERKAAKKNRRRSPGFVTGEFFDENNKPVDGTQTTFPIVGMKDGIPKLIATGFFFEHLGGFITAKHVLEEADIDPGTRFVMIHRISPNEYIPRMVEHVFNHPTADICIGKPHTLQEQGRDFENMVLNRDYGEPPVGSTLATYAYPNSFVLDPSTNAWRMVPEVFTGKVIEHCEKCPTSKFDSSCIHTDMNVLSGASGGPVFNESGVVIGVNSISYDINRAEENQTPISFVTPLFYLKKIEIKVGDEVMLFEELEEH